MTFFSPSRTLTFGLLLAWFLPVCALAHIAGGSLEKKVGPYLVDIGYDTVAITEGQAVEFHLGLIEKAGTLDWSYVPYDTLWFQLQEGTDVPFRQVISTQSSAPVTTTYTFKSAGQHHLAVRFLRNDIVLADATFTVPVASKHALGGTTKNLIIGLFVVALLVVMYVVWRRREAERRKIVVHRTVTRGKGRTKRR